MKKGILVLGMVLMGVGVFGQAGNWEWAKGATGDTNQEPTAMVTDASGNVYMVGYFNSHYIIFGQDTLYNANFLISGNPNGDVFIVKYNAMGNKLWSKRAGGMGDDEATSVTIDAWGDIYVTGYSTLDAIFDTDTLFHHGHPGIGNIFTVKYNSSGTEEWAKSAGGNYAFTGTGGSSGKSIASDGSGIYVTGWFCDSTINFDNYSLLVSMVDVSDMFIVKYDFSGNALWAKKFGGYGAELGLAIVTDGSGAYVTGTFSSSSILFGPDLLTYTIGGSYLGKDFFIVKYDTLGTEIWAKSAIGTDDEQPNSIASDASGIYITGYFQSATVIFDTIVLINTSSYNMFTVKYDGMGNVVWAKNTGDGMGANSVVADTSGIYITGIFYSTFIFRNDTLISAGSYDVFMLKYNSNGSPIWAKRTGGIGYDQGICAALGISDIYIAGWFMYNDCVIGSDILVHQGNVDVFIAKYNCNSTTVNTNLLTTPSRITTYPNPATNNFTIAFGSITKKVVLTITDITGKLIYTATASETEKMEVSTSSFAEGIYIVKIQTGEDVETRKLIVQK